MIISLVCIFILGYAFIAFEQPLGLNKAASALLTAGLSWTVFMYYSPDAHVVNELLSHQLAELSGILFFLLGAMVIVELIDAHDGFDIITSRITQHNKMRLLWVIAVLAFFLSAILDNLTTTIVMASLLRKLIKDEKDRVYFIGIVVVAANAGGAWSPIGDVTTTMLWIGGQLSSAKIMTSLFVPSLVCVLSPLIIVSFRLKGVVSRPPLDQHRISTALPRKQQIIVFATGLGVLLFVPVFKTLTHLPPYLGILFGLGFLWLVTELIHGKKEEDDREQLSVAHALRKIDTPSILFFFGILMSVAALQAAGILQDIATYLTNTIANKATIALLFGGLSAIIDNVPLVAAAQGMFSLDQFPMDHPFWHFLAYTTGTGGSLLIIGSAAGVAAMGLERINFFWYLKHISLLALLGYLAGAAVFLLQHTV